MKNFYLLGLFIIVISCLRISNLNAQNKPEIISGNDAIALSTKTNISNNITDIEFRKKLPYLMLETWEKLPYQKITSDSSFSNYLASIKIQGNSDVISDEQRKKLNESLLKMFFAFNEGTEKAYYDFRTPEGPQWKFTPLTLGIQVASFKSKVKNNESADFTFENLKQALFQNISGNGEGYKNFWLGVCLDEQEMRACLGDEKISVIPRYGITVYKTERFSSFESDFIDPQIYLRQRDSLKESKNKNDSQEEVTEAKAYKEMWPLFYNISGYQPNFEEHPTMRETYKKEGHLIFADIHCFVERNQQIPCPVLARFYWSSQFNIWIPEGFTVGGLNARDFIAKLKEVF
ncbi:MAG: hypothetical protein K6F29_01435 [Bacteroidales bacterium]|nr:hypothetical protein [Bacteroidales bacterium]